MKGKHRRKKRRPLRWERRGLLTRHHVIPQSVCRLHGIDPRIRGNVMLKRRDLHEAYHELFGAVTPWEAIRMLQNGEVDLTVEKRRRAHQLFFGRKSLQRAVAFLEKGWCGRLPTEVTRRFRELALVSRAAA